MKKYKKGQVIRFTGDAKKRRPVIFGVVIDITEVYIEVDFFKVFRNIKFNSNSNLISLASVKEVEHFIAERKKVLYQKIIESKRCYKNEMKLLQKQYPQMKEFINSTKDWYEI